MKQLNYVLGFILLLSFSFAVTGADNSPVPEGLVLYMPFDEVRGTTVNDFSGNDHNGLLVNGPSWTTGKKGNAVAFDGSHYVDLGASSWFDYQTFTISLWVYPGVFQLQYADIIDNNHRNGINWVIQQDMDDTNKYGWGDSSTLTHFELVPSVWSNLVVSRDGLSGENRVYVNGRLVNSSVSSSNINYDGTGYLRLGRWGGWLWNGHYREWNGLMDELKIYDRVLTAEEVKEGYDSATMTTASTTTTTTIAENSTTTAINQPIQYKAFEENVFIAPLAIVMFLALFLFWAFFIKPKKINSGNKSSSAGTTARFCPNCGSGVSPGDKFCRSCGKNM